MPATLYQQKHKQQPHCRFCGDKLKKRQEPVHFKAPFPKTKGEAARLTNLEITAVRWAGPEDDRHIESAVVWDGETYKGGYFCKIQCAVDFAWCAAQQGMETDAHKKATAYQREAVQPETEVSS